MVQLGIRGPSLFLISDLISAVASFSDTVVHPSPNSRKRGLPNFRLITTWHPWTHPCLKVTRKGFTGPPLVTWTLWTTQSNDPKASIMAVRTGRCKWIVAGDNSQVKNSIFSNEGSGFQENRIKLCTAGIHCYKILKIGSIKSYYKVQL